jgi:hypothetical protein
VSDESKSRFCQGREASVVKSDICASTWLRGSEPHHRARLVLQKLAKLKLCIGLHRNVFAWHE